MKVEIVGGNLVITAPIKEEVSKSGKSLLLASSGGNKATTVEYKGKPVIIGLNCYIAKD